MSSVSKEGSGKLPAPANKSIGPGVNAFAVPYS
jgi:hypothetical protein